MRQKHQLFIYDRKEVGVLIFLGVMVAVFAFTLGVHLGKRVGPKNPGPATVSTTETAPVAAVPDQVPSKQELTEQSKVTEPAVDDALSQSLHDEVAKTGIKLDRARQVDLPHEARAKNGGATTDLNQIKAELENTEKELVRTTALSASPRKFTLQVGSFPEEEEAKSRVASIAARGLKPFMRAADIKGRGTWYRIYVGDFSSKDEAEKMGEKYRAEHLIDSFVVAKLNRGMNLNP